MIISATNWTSVWIMTGMGIGIVFAILVILVLILQVFGMIAQKGAPAQAKAVVKAVPATSEDTVSEQEEAAVATALYLYFNEVHDQESYVLTIRHTHPTYGMEPELHNFNHQ